MPSDATPPPWQAPWPWLREHLVLVLTLSAFGLAAVRILSAAAGQPTITSELVRTLSLQTLLLSTAAPWIAVVLAVVALAVPERLLKQLSPRDRDNAAQWAIVPLALACAVIPIGVIVITAAYVAVFLAWWLLRGRRRIRAAGGTTGHSFRRYALALGPATLLLTTLFTRDMWLPTESITIAGSTPRTGFVLEEGPASVVILWDQPRELIRVPATQLGSRNFCELSANNRLGQPLFSFFWKAETPPPCPAAPRRP